MVVSDFRFCLWKYAIGMGHFATERPVGFGAVLFGWLAGFGGEIGGN